MSIKADMQRVSEETIRFMRGKYKLDEVAGSYKNADWLKFCQGKKTILCIYLYEERYDFQIIFGKVEREKFEDVRNEFPKFIQDLYDEAQTYHDGKWMMITVKDIETLEAVKKMIIIKKKPNRKPFPKDNAIYADCGHRCDLCVHYKNNSFSDEFREDVKARLRRVYENDSEESYYWGNDMEFCNGCSAGGLDGKFDCEQRKCAAVKGISKCTGCKDYPCDKATAGWPAKIELKSIQADDVTWAILPYVDNQYGN